MALAKSYFSGSRIIPCTSSEGRLCHIFGEISLWNEYFRKAHLELRELSPGRLSLVENHEKCTEACDVRDMPERMRAVATLLHHLLMSHHCVSSVAIFTSVSRDHHQLICDALCNSPSLTELKLYALRTATHTPRNIATTLLHLNHLRELELQGIPFNRAFIDGLSEFLVCTRSLTTLAVSEQHFDCEEDAVAFVEGLRRNQTIATLSFDTMLLRTDQFDRWLGIPVSSLYADVFAGYLHCSKTLRTLSMRGCRLFSRVARPIFEALMKHNTLTKLSLIALPLEYEDIELITSLLSHNRILTTFNMTRCICLSQYSQINSYLAAFTANKTLEELRLNCSLFYGNEYRSLFRALASNPSLKKVTVKRLRNNDVAEICRAARETGAEERFFVGTHCAGENTVDALTECKELSSVEVQWLYFDRLEPLLTTLSLLPSCSHVTSLGVALRQDEFQGRTNSLIAQCITGMTALRKLRLAIDRAGTGVAFNEAMRELAQALSVNKTIRKLRLHGPLFGETEIEMLADTVQSSRTLCDMLFFPRSRRSVIFLLRKLSPNISGNYTLLHMSLQRPWKLGGDWFTVVDVISRNCSLVTRAAHFVVMGTRLKYCAEAVEQMHSNPGLVEKVRELACVDEDEAASRIKKSLRSFSELDDFMRIVGVVKYGVTCQSRDDGQTQLVDIGRDCWLYIRQYVKVGDILDEQ